MGTATWAEVYKGKNEGAIGFATAEEANAAIGYLSGSILNGANIKCESYAPHRIPFIASAHAVRVVLVV